MKRLMELADKLANSGEFYGCEFSVVLPGAPMDGREIFYQQDEKGPAMLTLTKGEERCFLWFECDDSEHCSVRVWIRIGKDGSVRNFAVLEEALSFLKETMPTVITVDDDFENLKREFLSRYKPPEGV